MGFQHAIWKWRVNHKPDPKGGPLGTRTMIEEVLDEEFFDLSSLDDDDTDSEDDSHPQMDIMGEGFL